MALSDELITISAMMMLAKERGEIVRLAGELNTVIEKAMQIEKAPAIHGDKRKALSTSIKFNKQEIDQMSKTFKKEFIAGGCVAHIIKRPSGKTGVYYEIRYRRNGYNLTVSNTDLKTAKNLFIEATKKLESPETITRNKLKFEYILNEWLDYKKDKITYKQWQNHKSRADKFIPHEIKVSQIKDIRTVDIDKVLKSFDKEPRQFEEIRSLFNQVFKYAKASGIVTYNPVELIPFKRAERNNREALTTEQIKIFLKKIKEPQYDNIRQSVYVLYFFGIRPCELDKETRFENGFLICRNRKRKGGKIEYKKIPIPLQALEFIDFNKPITFPLSYAKSLDIFKKLFGDKVTFYNLRHTFASVCAEFVRQDIVEIWMGDSPERLVGKVYVHFKDEFMISQMAKVKFITE